MARMFVYAVALLGCGTCLSADAAPDSFAAAQAIFASEKDSAEAQSYIRDFTSFNYAKHLHRKGGCLNMPGETPTVLMLVVTPAADNSAGVITGIFSDQANAKILCLEKAYRGVRFRSPPSSPFVIRMQL